MSNAATQISNLELRQLEPSDYPRLREVMVESYKPIDDEPWTREQFCRLIEVFPEGQMCIEADKRLVAASLCLRVNYAAFAKQHSYRDVTARDTFRSHYPEGDALYGIDLVVHPDYRGMRLGRRLYDARKELCESLNLKAIMFGGRIPNYAEHADSLSAREYIQRVKQREIHDPVLSFQLSNDFHVKRILTDYLKGDHQSKEYAVLLEWPNIYFHDASSPTAEVESARIGLVQWQNRRMRGFEEFRDQMEFFVDSISDYQSDFLLFPEFFSAPLMAEFSDLDEPAAIRGLASYSPRIVEQCTDFALRYNVNILTGGMPFLEDGKLYNAGYLCRRDGGTERYEKLHVTPSEREAWGMTGGSILRAMDTDAGRIGVLVCYDVEFPELGRLLAEEGIQILFVPFMTDTQSGYARVRVCAQARAIENECYVAIAGCVGHLPKVNHMDIQYAQSAVFTPSDFAFPTNGIRSEATPNTESTLIVDVDLSLLKELHVFGAVRNLKDRRRDLYELRRSVSLKY